HDQSFDYALIPLRVQWRNWPPASREAAAPPTAHAQPLARRQYRNRELAGEVLCIPSDERVETRSVLLDGERDLRVLERDPLLHHCEDVARRRRRKLRVVATPRHHGHAIALGEVYVQGVKGHRRKVEAQDATNLEHVQGARHSGPVAPQPGERAT